MSVGEVCHCGHTRGHHAAAGEACLAPVPHEGGICMCLGFRPWFDVLAKEGATQPLVVVESPFADPTPEGREKKSRYLSACLADCLARGEAPFASHGLYTRPGVLDDDVPQERERGIRTGFAWRRVASGTAVYCDLGVSLGMLAGMADARREWARRRTGTLYREHPELLPWCAVRVLGGEWGGAETHKALALEAFRASDVGPEKPGEVGFAFVL
jgi:hypothetical protein